MQTSGQIAAMLSDYGVTHFFFVPVILPETIKRMSARGIAPVMTHGEKAGRSATPGGNGVARSLAGNGVARWSLIQDHALLIQVDIDGAEIGRTFKCAVPAVGDVRAVIGAVCRGSELPGTRAFAAAASFRAPEQWIAEIAELRAEWRPEF
jgi:hypothetical protein